jgi:hypothetical protein
MIIRYGLFLSLLGLGTAAAWLSSGAADRPTVIRAAAALLVGVALRHGVKVLGRRLESGAPFPKRSARSARAVAPADPLFGRLRDELRYSAASDTYFREVLWPRLRHLAARRARCTAYGLVIPEGRKMTRRGPSLGRLAALIAAIEEEAQ